MVQYLFLGTVVEHNPLSHETIIKFMELQQGVANLFLFTIFVK